MQKLILVDSKTGERLLEFDKSLEGLSRLADFSCELISERKKLWRNSQDTLRRNLRTAAANDFMQNRIDWTDDVVNRYGLEIVPIEQIERESKRRGWIKE